MPAHRLTLKFPDRCVDCGTELAAGTRANWDSATRRVWCLVCPEVPQVHALQERWERLVRYLRRCVEAEAASALLPLGSNRWTALPLGQEPVFTGGARQVPLHPHLDRLAGRLQSGQSLFYGWPAVVHDGCVAPLFAVELARPTRVGAGLALLEEPALNHALVCEDRFDGAAVAAARALSGTRLPVGDAEGMVHLVDAMARLLGLEVSGRSRLLPELPRAPGVHDVALAVIAESGGASRALVEELAALEGRTDWAGTAAAWLLDPTRPEDLSRPGAPAAPLPLDRAQEAAAQALRQRALSVITAPPGTGRSHLVAAALANAWMDGDTVLLVSTDNTGVERAREVHPALVLRTEDLPSLVGTLAASEALDEAAARRDLELACLARQEAREAAERRSARDLELLQATEAEEDAFRRAWGGPPFGEPDPAVVLLKAERLARASFLGGLRRSWYLRKLACLPSARVEDVMDWARAVLRVRAALVELAPEPSLQAAGEEWVRASLVAIRAAVSARLSRESLAVEALGRARLTGPGLAQAVAAARPALRGWACTALSVKQGFPLQAASFDLVVVDEANRCTLAAVLPLAYRARRLAVMGDPNQVGPVVTLDDVRLEGLAAACGFTRPALEQAGLDHGGGSAFAAYAKVTGVVLLDEHYRCHPAIAGWFNRSFYAGALTVVTDVCAFPPGRRGLVWTDVPGEARPGPGGSVVNEAEAAALVQFLKVEWDSGASLGVVTPFAAQAALIRRLAEREFPRGALAAVEFTCGTIGVERDVVAFSAVLAPGVNPRTARWLEGQRHLLNVAASRARRALVVFGHPTPGIPTLESLREAGLSGVPPRGSVHPEAERRLCEALRARGLSPVPNSVVEGFELDLELPGLDVEVDGPQHVDTQGRQRTRDRVLEGLGFRVLRVPAWRCLRDPQGAAEEVLSLCRPAGHT